MSVNGCWQRVGAVGFLCLALGLFTWRTMIRSGVLDDFHALYAAGEAMLHGRNPYDQPAVAARWRQMAPALPPIDHLLTVVSPVTILLVTPVCLLPPVAASWVWMGLCVVLMVGLIVLAIHLGGFRPGSAAACLLAGSILLFEPVQLGVHVGQASTVCIFCLVLGVALLRRGRTALAGVALGLSMAWKPQIGALGIGYCVLAGEWRAAGWGMGVFAALGGVAVGWMQASGRDWVHSWMSNIQQLAKAGGLDSYDLSNATRDHLINLQVLLYPLTGSHAFTGVVAWLVALALGLALVWLLRRMGQRESLLLGMSAVCAVGCLPVYHRQYDAAFLVLVLAWAGSQLCQRRWRKAMPVMLFLVPFYLPVGWATNLVHKGYVPLPIGDSWWWRTLVEPVPTLALLCLSIALLVRLGGERSALVCNNSPSTVYSCS